MNKKGFTLVELLAVIVILGILALITTPVVINIIDDSKNKAYEEQKRLVEGAAERWGVNNLKKLPTTDGASCYITTETLLNEGYLSSAEINDPTKNESIKRYVLITYSSAYKQYKYDYTDIVSSNSCN